MLATPWAVGRVTPCAPLLAYRQTGFPLLPPSKLSQVPVFTIGYPRCQHPQSMWPRRPWLPSTGRLPRSLIAPCALEPMPIPRFHRVNTRKQRLPLLGERAGVRAGFPCSCPTSGSWAGIEDEGGAAILLHRPPQNPRNNTFYVLRHQPNNPNARHPLGGRRVTPCAPLLAYRQTGFPLLPPPKLSQVPVFTIGYPRCQRLQSIWPRRPWLSSPLNRETSPISNRALRP